MQIKSNVNLTNKASFQTEYKVTTWKVGNSEINYKLTAITCNTFTVLDKSNYKLNETI